MEICLPEEKAKAKEWAPLIMKGRDDSEPICMTKVPHGTDVDYGALTKAKIVAFQELGAEAARFDKSRVKENLAVHCVC
ncbi:mqo [Symbiodinium sp. CCMP2456]|nr:mqo [Symbiodinium sp. CCMP2456]